MNAQTVKAPSTPGPVFYTRRKTSNPNYMIARGGYFVRKDLINVPGANRREKKAFLRAQRRRKTGIGRVAA